MLLAIDEEGGDVTRLEWETGSSYPGGAALGVVDDPAPDRERRRVDRRGARRGRCELEPRAGRRRERAREPGDRDARVRLRRVARRAARRRLGSRAAEPARRRVCEALARPRVDRRRTRTSSCPRSSATCEAGLEPFRAAIAAGVQSIMTAHIRVHDLPATIDPALVQGMLRDELGFDGVVMADALEMKAVSATYGDRERPPCGRSTRASTLSASATTSARTRSTGFARRSSRTWTRAGCARPPDESRGSREWARPSGGQRRPCRCGRGSPARAARRGRRHASARGPVRRRAPPAGEHRRRRGRARARDTRSSCARASTCRAPTCSSSATPTGMRGCGEAADAPDAIVVETGLPVWRPSHAPRLRRDLRGRACLARGGGGGAGTVTSHLERELREQPEALARLIEKQLRLCRGDRRALSPQRRPVRADRLARQLVERRALRAVPARPRAPRAGRVRDALALHALRAAAAARRRARRRHLAVRRVSGRRRGRARGEAARAGRRSRSRTRRRRRSASPRTRSSSSRRARSRPSQRRRRTSTRSARSR